MKYGLKEGVGRAAAKMNPVLMVIEAAASVAEAVNSYLKLREAQAHRDGLQQLIPHDAEKLRLERAALNEELALAKAEIDQQMQVQQRIGALALACSSALSTAWSELEAIRSSELPDIEAFDRNLDEVDTAWQQFRHALSLYREYVDSRLTGEYP